MKVSQTIIQIAKNTFSSWGMVAVQAAVGLVMVPFMLGHLGKEGYGVLGIIGAIIGFSAIADLGLRAALERELAEKVAAQDADGFRSLSSTSLFLYVALALLIAGIITILAPWLCSVFMVGVQYHDLAVRLLRTYAPLTVFLSFVTPVFTAGICSFMRYDVQNHITTFSNLVISLMLLVFLSASDANPLIVWCLVMMAGAVIRTGVLWAYYRRFCFDGKLGMRWVDFRILRSLFQLGGKMYVLQLTQMIAVQMDPLIISRFIGPVGVAVYQAGSKLPQMVNPLVTSLTSQLTPLTTKYHVASNLEWEQRVLILGTRYTLYLGAFFSAAMIVFGDSFCRLWLFDTLGEDVKTVGLVLKMWSVANLFSYAAGSQWPILLGKKKIDFVVAVSCITSILNIVCSVYLVGFTSLGIVGVLVGTVITEIIRRPILIWYASKQVKLMPFHYLRAAYIPPLLFLSAVLLIGVCFIAGPEINWMGLMLKTLIFFMVSAGVFCAIERSLIFRLFNARKAMKS
jgi:O-antigen/teichoic acid export membrane protein